MHREDSQQNLLSEMRSKVVDDPLAYEEFQYQNKEWDNIPFILPRWFMHLDRHLRAIINYCFTKSQEETTQQLRQEIYKSLEVRTLLYANLAKSAPLGDRGAFRCNGREKQGGQGRHAQRNPRDEGPCRNH